MHVCNHEPYGDYPRSTFAGETAFYLAWKEIADTQIEQVINTLYYAITDRETRLVSGFMSWLGTACGKSFLDNAENLSKTLNSRKFGYMYAWADENQRVVWQNSGHRTIEGIASDELELTIYDYEIIDQAVRWLTTATGQEFIATATSMIKKCKDNIDLFGVLQAK